MEKHILVIRDEKVLLDEHLADLYGVDTRILVQAVKRNADRFPADFAFQLTKEEFEALRSQSVISKPKGRGGRRTPPYAFTEQGVAMLSSVLQSARAIQVNVEIMRAFVRLRGLLAEHEELRREIAALRRESGEQFKRIWQVIGQLMAPDAKPRRPIGFGGEKAEDSPRGRSGSPSLRSQSVISKKKRRKKGA